MGGSEASCVSSMQVTQRALSPKPELWPYFARTRLKVGSRLKHVSEDSGRAAVWCLDGMIGKPQYLLSYTVRPAGLGHSAAPGDTPAAGVAGVAFIMEPHFSLLSHTMIFPPRLWKCRCSKHA